MGAVVTRAPAAPASRQQNDKRMQEMVPPPPVPEPAFN